MTPYLSLPLIGLAVLAAAMTAAWLVQRRTRNAGIVDVLWTLGLGAYGVFYAVVADGWGPRRWLVGALVALWAGRLAWHLARRVAGEAEDGRYRDLRETLGTGIDRWLFVFFQAQAILAALLSYAFLIPAQAAEPGWRIWDGLAVVLWLVSIGGEGLADRQLAAWRRNPANRGRTCRSGLWAYSRHPNYFFEWIHWLVYPTFAIGLPGGWAIWLAPALMLYLILKVTGIPPTEAQSVRSRGDDYRDYQRCVNAFFPGPPKCGTDRRYQTSS
jgi:steroid 5-alpha reductase family enzyme